MAVSINELDSDYRLVVAAQSGDAAAFGELFRRHHSAVRRACARRLGDLREADEVAQAAFVRAWERIDRCGGERKFGAWVQVIARHLCVDTVRDRSRVTIVDDRLAHVRAPALDEPEDVVIRAEAADLVRSALADLPSRQRRVVVARDLEERRPSEIAAALGVSVGAVDSLLLRGRRRLATVVQRLNGEGGAITTTSGSVVAVGAAGTSGRLVGLVQSAQDVVARASYHLAVSLGAVPGVTPPGQRFAVAAALGGALAAGAAAPGSGPVVPAMASVPSLPVEAPALPARPVAAVPAAPAAPAPVTPAAPTTTPPDTSPVEAAPGAAAVALLDETAAGATRAAGTVAARLRVVSETRQAQRILEHR